MRYGGGEPGAELVVRGVLRRLAQVEERLALAEHVERDLDRAPSVECTRRQTAAHREIRQRLASPSARGHDAPLRIEHQDDLAALLDRGTPPCCFDGHVTLFGL